MILATAACNARLRALPSHIPSRILTRVVERGIDFTWPDFPATGHLAGRASHSRSLEGMGMALL